MQQKKKILSDLDLVHFIERELKGVLYSNFNFLKLCHYLGKVYNTNPLDFYCKNDYLYVLKLFYYCFLDKRAEEHSKES